MHNSSLYQFYIAFSVVSELYSLPPELAHKLHLLHLLRAKLVHFVNNLNNYLITRVTYNFVVNVTFIVLFFFLPQILHSTGLEFHEKLEEAEDLDKIIKLHQDYTNIIFDRCLLNKKVGHTITVAQSLQCGRIAIF